jgi:hypothetical protein
MSSGGAWSLLEGAARFEGFRKNMEVANEAILTRWAVEVQKRAKESLGVYQKGWPALAPSTVERKGHDMPLIDTFELKESISGFVEMHGPEHGRAVVGTPLDRGLWAEVGTQHEPPRPWLLPAAVEAQKDVKKFAKECIRAAWVGAGNSDLMRTLHAIRLLLHVARDVFRAQ